MLRLAKRVEAHEAWLLDDISREDVTGHGLRTGSRGNASPRTLRLPSHARDRFAAAFVTDQHCLPTDIVIPNSTRSSDETPAARLSLSSSAIRQLIMFCVQRSISSRMPDVFNQHPPRSVNCHMCASSITSRSSTVICTMECFTDAVMNKRVGVRHGPISDSSAVEHIVNLICP